MPMTMVKVLVMSIIFATLFPPNFVHGVVIELTSTSQIRTLVTSVILSCIPSLKVKQTGIVLDLIFIFKINVE